MFYFLNLFFNWRTVALQCCVSFCCTTTQISHNYASIISLLSRPPLPPPHSSAASAAKSFQSCLTVQRHTRQPTRLHRPWDSPGKNTGVGCHFLLQCMKVKSESEFAQSCPTLWDPMDCRSPGSSVHRIFQARVLEWVAIAITLLGSSQSAWLGFLCYVATSHQLSILHMVVSLCGEGNGTPLQYSCLENPMDGGAW